jgi:hypothetical protein
MRISEYLSGTSKKAFLTPDLFSKKFTQRENPLVNEKILTDLSTIVIMIRKGISDSEDIILVGSFGRGEGSVLDEETGIQPVNDYDIVITSELPLNQDLLRSLSIEIATTIGIRFVDLMNIPIENLKSLPNTTFNYDLKYGGVVIYGNPRILEEIPDMNPSNISLIEGKILLFNRLICLVECFNYDFLKRVLTSEEKFFTVNQCNKVILACCDAHLMLQGKYHHSYREKDKRYQNLISPDMKLLNFVNRATIFKLIPTKKIDFDVVDYWFDVKKLYFDTLLMYLNRTFVLSKNLSSFVEFGEFYAGYSLNSKKSSIELAEIFILLSITKEVIDLDYLKLAREQIVNITGQNLVEFDWEKSRKEVTRLWYKFNH